VLVDHEPGVTIENAPAEAPSAAPSPAELSKMLREYVREEGESEPVITLRHRIEHSIKACGSDGDSRNGGSPSYDDDDDDDGL
jgi:hypothetical protein